MIILPLIDGQAVLEGGNFDIPRGFPRERLMGTMEVRDKIPGHCTASTDVRACHDDDDDSSQRNSFRVGSDKHWGIGSDLSEPVQDPCTIPLGLESAAVDVRLMGPHPSRLLDHLLRLHGANDTRVVRMEFCTLAGKDCCSNRLRTGPHVAFVAEKLEDTIYCPARYVL